MIKVKVFNYNKKEPECYLSGYPSDDLNYHLNTTTYDKKAFIFEEDDLDFVIFNLNDRNVLFEIVDNSPPKQQFQKGGRNNKWKNLKK